MKTEMPTVMGAWCCLSSPEVLSPWLPGGVFQVISWAQDRVQYPYRQMPGQSDSASKSC